MFQETRSILESIWPLVSDLGSEMAEGNITERNLTLFLAQLLYQVTATATTIGQGEPDREIKERIDICKRLLQLMEARWRVTSKFDAEEFCVNPQLILPTRSLCSHFRCA